LEEGSLRVPARTLGVESGLPILSLGEPLLRLAAETSGLRHQGFPLRRASGPDLFDLGFQDAAVGLAPRSGGHCLGQYGSQPDQFRNL